MIEELFKNNQCEYRLDTGEGDSMSPNVEIWLTGPRSGVKLFFLFSIFLILILIFPVLMTQFDFSTYRLEFTLITYMSLLLIAISLSSPLYFLYYQLKFYFRGEIQINHFKIVHPSNITNHVNLILRAPEGIVSSKVYDTGSFETTRDEVQEAGLSFEYFEKNSLDQVKVSFFNTDTPICVKFQKSLSIIVNGIKYQTQLPDKEFNKIMISSRLIFYLKNMQDPLILEIIKPNSQRSLG